MTDEIKARMMELRERGLGYRKIAKEVGLNVGSVTIYFRRLKEKQNATYCKACGKKLKQTKGHRQKIFCDADCRYYWVKHHRYECNLKAYHEFICAWCGKPFTSYGNKKRKYCCRACYMAAHTKKER